MNTNQVRYYAERAPEYEKSYNRTERKEDVDQLSQWVIDTFQEKTVLEIACGTGYWTHLLSKHAKQVLATDINKEMLDVAKEKEFSNNVEFKIADIHDLSNISTNMESGFAGFILSHILIEDLPSFMTKFLSKIENGGPVVFIDDLYIEGVSSAVHSSDEKGNEFQTRTLENGSVHLIIKNYPTDEQVHKLLDPIATDIEIIKLKYFWMLRFSNNLNHEE
ncbi:MAG: methyltransferase domain-containing protein [Bacteroidetes bacterium]|nr:methyltransferase domain-containing protein [Bacteroidota bacterium]